MTVSVQLVPAVVGTVPYLIFPKLENALDLQWRLYLHHIFCWQVVVDVEAVVRDYLSTASGGPTAKDPPPKYEEVADMPPQYDPSTMGAARP